MEETTDWVYGFFSLLSDIISSEGDEEDDDDAEEDADKGTKSSETSSCWDCCVIRMIRVSLSLCTNVYLGQAKPK